MKTTGTRTWKEHAEFWCFSELGLAEQEAPAAPALYVVASRLAQE